MSHRAAVYTVRVYPSRKRKPDLCLIGDFDTSGTWLGDTVDAYFRSTFSAENAAQDRVVRCESSATTGDEVRSMFVHGQTGMVADIMDRHGQLQWRQTTTDTHLVRCASVFRLDRNQTIGWWAVHVNNGRGAKSLIEGKLIEMFKAQHDDLTLAIRPSVNEAALRAAVDAGRVDSIHLVRLEKPDDRAAAATDKWVDAGEIGRLDLRISGDHHRWLKAGLLKRFLDGERSVHGNIVEFAGIRFDEAKVAVELDDGRQRTFNIEAPDAGHPFTRDLDGLALAPDGEPTPDSLYAKLGEVLDELG